MMFRSTFLLASSALLFQATARAITLLESSCLMRLSFPTDEDISLLTAFDVEKETSDYFEDILFPYESGGLLSRVEPLSFRVAVADRILTGPFATVTAAVTLLYEYDETNEELEPLELATVMSEAIKEASPTAEDFQFGNDDGPVVVEFQNLEDSSVILDIRGARGRSSVEIGLIVGTTFMAIMLVIVSSVLLYITGGWYVFKNKVINCLFVEVEDDEYVVQRKSTYPVKSTSESEDDDSEFDQESHITSLPPDSASGILGVARNTTMPAAALGDLSPRSDDESSMMYGDGETPTSHLDNGPLGIASQPAYNDTPARAAFSGMVMQRFGRHPGK